MFRLIKLTDLVFYNSKSSGWIPRLLYGDPEDVDEVVASRSSVEPIQLHTAKQVGVCRNTDNPVKLRVFIDRIVIEVFVNGWHVITERVYFSREESADFSIEARGTDAILKSL